jgi:hypothetical protein
MSPTLDEQATISDPQVTADYHAARLFAVLSRAIEHDGMPRPLMVMLSGGTEPYALTHLSADHVDDWARLLGVKAALDPTISRTANRAWQRYTAEGILDGVRLQARCSVDVPDDAKAALEAENAALRARLNALEAGQVTP